MISIMRMITYRAVAPRNFQAPREGRELGRSAVAFVDEATPYFAVGGSRSDALQLVRTVDSGMRPG